MSFLLQFHSSECVEKFGESLGHRIWQTVNECFDVMPVSAVVEDKVSVLLW